MLIIRQGETISDPLTILCDLLNPLNDGLKIRAAVSGLEASEWGALQRQIETTGTFKYRKVGPKDEDREAIGWRLAAERGMTLIPPFDHPHVMAGQGTAAAELIGEVGRLDTLLVCVGGGGLIAGSAVAAHHHSPGLRVLGVEPEAGNDTQQSLARGVARVEDRGLVEEDEPRPGDQRDHQLAPERMAYALHPVKCE